MEQFKGMALWLDEYDDIFSDFDSRDYDQRAISDDFLHEVKKISREGADTVSEFRLLMPESKRVAQKEDMIVKRLHSYFRKNLHRVELEVKRSRKMGILFSLAGTIMLLIAGYITLTFPGLVAGKMIVILCEPAAWFFIWMGYDNLMNARTRRRSELGFYTSLAGSKVSFHSLPVGK